LAPLISRGFEVHGISSRTPVTAVPGVRWHRLDLLDFGHLGSFLADTAPSHLLHLAWETAPGRYWTSTDNVRWLEASLELLRAFSDAGGRRAVLAGTCAEYDWGGKGSCFEETTRTEPASLYGACKLALYNVGSAFGRERGLSTASGRVFFLYGPGERPERLVPSIVRSLLLHETLRCTPGDQVRDFYYVEDAAGAFVALLDSEVSGAVNVASGEGTTIRGLAGRIAEKLGRAELIQWGAIPTPATDPPVLVADVRRLTSEVGWTPQYSVDTALDRTIAWWRHELRGAK
jgi:nucleoside-diphosphate-sugar epimerase